MQPNQYLFNEPTGNNPVMQGFGQGANLAALQQGMAQKQTMNAEAAELSKNPTSRGIRDFSIKWGVGDKMQGQMDHLSAEEKRNRINQGAQVYAALNNGDHKISRARAAELEETYKNAGKPEDAKMWGDLVRTIDEDPTSARFQLGLIMSGVMGDDFKIFTDMEKTSAETSDIDAKTGGQRIQNENAQDVHDAAMAESKSRTDKLIEEIKGLADSSGKIKDPKEKYKAELDLSNNYKQNGGEAYENSVRAWHNIKEANLTGVGGLTTILSYMKMIDPTSVVSSNEQATAANAPGVPVELRNLYNRYFSEGELDEKGATQFKVEARRMLTEFKIRADTHRERLTKSAISFGLNPEHIFIDIKPREMDEPKPDTRTPYDTDKKSSRGTPARQLKVELVPNYNKY